MADGLNAAKKYVATHRPESLEWGPFEGLGPDIVEGVSPYQVTGRPGPYPLVPSSRFVVFNSRAGAVSCTRSPTENARSSSRYTDTPC
jgi:hypothetical protein